MSVVDQGGLNYVIAARVEAAVRAAFPDLPPCSPARRAPRRAERDAPRRSRLYAPGNSPRLLVGIELHGADCVLLDLEDSVPPAEKAAARVLGEAPPRGDRLPRRSLGPDQPPRPAAGGTTSPRSCAAGRTVVALPKAESKADVAALSKELASLEKSLGIPVGTTFVMPILETAKGILHAEEIAAADPRVAALAFGAEDFTRDVGARRTPESLLFARSMLVAAAKAAGVQASDTVYADVENEKGLLAEATLARDLGFDGKGAIHPAQIGPLHAVFSPSEKELEEARKVVAAAEDAERRGIGAIAIGGKMIDRPVLERARRALFLADRLARRDSR